MGRDILFHFEKGNDLLTVDPLLHPDNRHSELFDWIMKDAEFSGRGMLTKHPNLGTHGWTYFYLDEINRVNWKKECKDWDFYPDYFIAFFKHVLPRLTNTYTSLAERDIRITIGFSS